MHNHRLHKTLKPPRRIHCDNGSEFAGRLVDLWAYANKVELVFSRPGKPTDNAFIESFNGSLRDECLNVHWFRDLTDARAKLQAWMKDYNESRPHRALNNLSHLEYKATWAAKRPENHCPPGLGNGGPSMLDIPTLEVDLDKGEGHRTTSRINMGLGSQGSQVPHEK